MMIEDNELGKNVLECIYSYDAKFPLISFDNGKIKYGKSAVDFKILVRKIEAQLEKHSYKILNDLEVSKNPKEVLHSVKEYLLSERDNSKSNVEEIVPSEIFNHLEIKVDFLNIDKSDKITEGLFLVKDDRIYRSESVKRTMSFKDVSMEDCLAKSLSERCTREFIPFIDTPKFKRSFADGSGDYTVYNDWESPQWRKDLEKYKETYEGPPELFIKLLNNLVPTKIDKDYLLYWSWRSLVSRAWTFLCMVGRPGAGKNKYVRVLEALHGVIYGNVTHAKDNTFNSNFNAPLIGSTLVFVDEAKVTKKEENYFKMLANGKTAVERKGVDATKVESFNASIILASNHLTDIYVSMDARKFAAIGLFETRLETRMSLQDLQTIDDYTEEKGPLYNPEWVAHVFLYLEEIGPQIKEKYNWVQDEYRGIDYWKLARTSMSAQITAFINFMESNWNSRLAGVVVPLEGTLGKVKFSEVHKIAKKDPNIKQIISRLPADVAFKDLINYRSEIGEIVYEVAPISSAAAHVDFDIIRREEL